MASSDFPRFLAPTLFALGCGLVPQSALGQDSCGAPNTNSCCVASLTPGCGDAWCCEFVCSIDPFCCTNQWDAICANITIGTCDGCFGGSTSCGDPEAATAAFRSPGPSALTKSAATSCASSTSSVAKPRGTMSAPSKLSRSVIRASPPEADAVSQTRTTAARPTKPAGAPTKSAVHSFARSILFAAP